MALVDQILLDYKKVKFIGARHLKCGQVRGSVRQKDCALSTDLAAEEMQYHPCTCAAD